MYKALGLILSNIQMKPHTTERQRHKETEIEREKREGIGTIAYVIKSGEA